jgi:hypothetical protein
VDGGRLTQEMRASLPRPVIADFCNKIGQKQTSRHILHAMSALADIVKRPVVSPSVDIGSSCTLSISCQRDTSSMSDIAHAKTETQSPQGQLIQMATAHWVSRFLYVAARMNLADQLAERSKTAEELAQSMGTTVPSLYRFIADTGQSRIIH